jgi:MoxR-like ATPase
MEFAPTDQNAARFYVFPDDPLRSEALPAQPVALVPAPEWRNFHGEPTVSRSVPAETRGVGFQRRPEVALRVNAALALRRPLLVTGSPGSGKTTLAYAISRELGLGQVLRWNITSRSTLREALYSYDVLGRLNQANLAKPGEPAPPIDDFIRLGPLGTALLPTAHPRVLLIDELDKSDLDLPNDLLHVFEEGNYEIEELRRETMGGKQRDAEVSAADGEDRVTLRGGRVQCQAFPVVVITSNGEREFSPAFLRRCVRLTMPEPKDSELAAIAAAHGVGDSDEERLRVAQLAAAQMKKGMVTTDQLLNALHLINGETARAGAVKWADTLTEATLEPLTGNRGGSTGQ